MVRHKPIRHVTKLQPEVLVVCILLWDVSLRWWNSCHRMCNFTKQELNLTAFFQSPLQITDGNYFTVRGGQKQDHLWLQWRLEQVDLRVCFEQNHKSEIANSVHAIFPSDQYCTLLSVCFRASSTVGAITISFTKNFEFKIVWSINYLPVSEIWQPWYIFYIYVQ